MRPALAAPGVYRIVDVDRHRRAIAQACGLSAASAAASPVPVSCASSPPARPRPPRLRRPRTRRPGRPGSPRHSCLRPRRWRRSAATAPVLQRDLAAFLLLHVDQVQAWPASAGLSALPMVWPPTDSSHFPPPLQVMAATTWPSSFTSTAWFCTCSCASRRRNGQPGLLLLAAAALELDCLDMIVRQKETAAIVGGRCCGCRTGAVAWPFDRRRGPARRRHFVGGRRGDGRGRGRQRRDRRQCGGLGTLVITTMLMRRLIGFCGSVLSNSTDDDSPTTRATLSSPMPPSSRARRAALARSALSSQLL